MRTHFRVVWKRQGLKPKVKRYVVRKNAERLMNILTSPEPWLYYSVPKQADDYFCCPGGVAYECGCMGITVKQEADEKWKDIPPLEWVRLEQRDVTPWQPTGVVVEFPKPKVEESFPAEAPF
jgi:hypothetical protein